MPVAVIMRMFMAVTVIMMIVVMRVMIVLVMFCGFGEFITSLHVDLRRPDSAAIDRAESELRFDIKRFGCLPQDFHRDAGIYERPQEHVPTNAREAFQISNAHGLLFRRPR